MLYFISRVLSIQTDPYQGLSYQFHTFVKHVLAPQDDFGMQKKTWQTDKKVGLGQTPPPSMGKIPT